MEATSRPATPLPWEMKDIGACFAIRGDGNGHCVADTNPASKSKHAVKRNIHAIEEQRANAAYIAHAANAYPRLVAALNLAYAKLDDKAAKEEIGALLQELGE